MTTLITTPILSFFATAFFVWATIKAAAYFNLKEANDERKTHTEKVSALGGIGIFLGTWATLFLSGIEMTSELFGLLGGSAVLFATGLVDDFICLSAKARICVQLAVGAMAFGLGLNFQFLFELPVWADAVITLLFFATLINAFNLIDGINGLSGGLGVLAMFGFSMLFAQQANFVWLLVSLTCLASYLGFLKFNFGKKAKIFMGDNGSTVIGFTIGVLFLISAKAGVMANFEHLLFLVLVAGVAVLDLVTVFFLRMATGKSPFSADRNHIHHLLVDNGFSHRRASAILYLSQMTLFILVKIIGAIAFLPAVVSLGVLYGGLRFTFGHKQELVATLNVPFQTNLFKTS